MKGYIILTVKFEKEGNRWTAECLELGTATFGRSINEAKEKISEAILVHLNILEDVGERERFFKEHNIRILKSKPKPRSIPPTHVPVDENILIQQRLQPVA